MFVVASQHNRWNRRRVSSLEDPVLAILSPASRVSCSRRIFRLTTPLQRLQDCTTSGHMLSYSSKGTTSGHMLFHSTSGHMMIHQRLQPLVTCCLSLPRVQPLVTCCPIHQPLVTCWFTQDYNLWSHVVSVFQGYNLCGHILGLVLSFHVRVTLSWVSTRWCVSY